jgi:enoyl-CoA hydratase
VESTCFRVEHVGKVAHLILNRPDELNTMTRQFWGELPSIVGELDAAGETRAIVISSTGKHFSAGADLNEFGTAGGVMPARRIRWLRDPWTPLWEVPQPTIVALHGYALGAGLEMAMLCDLRLCSPDTTLGLPETKRGMRPSAGGTQSLVRAVGRGTALDLVMSAETIDAERALSLGVVDRIAAEVDEAARELALRIASLDPNAVAAARRSIRDALDLGMAEGLRLERVLAARLRAASR